MAKLKVGLNHPKQTIQLNPLEIHEMIIKRNKQDSSQLVVDPTLFYLDHCKVHPIDLVFDLIKKSAENGRRQLIINPYTFLDNLDYEEKKVKKTGDWPETFWQRVFHKTVHHEWEETDNEHRRHYWRMVENITLEVRNYLWKTGWDVKSWKQYEDSEARMLQISL